MKGINALTEVLKKMVLVRDLLLNLSANSFITSQGFSDLCSSIKCLKDLAYLDLDLSLGLSMNSKNAEELAETLRSLDSLEIFHFNCREVWRVGNRQEIFQTLFEVLQKKEKIQDVILTLGERLDPPEALKFNQSTNFSLY